MPKIKTLSEKQSNGTFSTPTPIGVDGVNVDLEEGINLEQKLASLGLMYLQDQEPEGFKAGDIWFKIV